MTGSNLTRAYAIFSMLLLVGNSAFAQKGDQGSQQQKTIPKIAVTSRLIDVNVIVHDKKRNPVTGLTANDFTITDGSHAQRIVHFSVVTSAPSPSASPAGLPPDVYTNLPSQNGEAPGSVTIILLDRLNTNFLDQSWVRPQIIKYLGNIKPSQRVALYALGYQLQVVHDFTSDSSALIAAVRSMASMAPHQLEPVAAPDGQSAATSAPTLDGESTSSAAEQQIIQALSTFLEDVNMRAQLFNLDDRVQILLASFETIARHVSGLPGRKNLIWVSGVFPIQFGALGSINSRDYGGSVERVTQELSNANVAVYPVDARGLIPPDLGLTQPIRSSRRQALASASVVPPSIDPNEIESMETIAHNTGGEAFYNRNDIEDSIERAVNDGSYSYVLGYYPDHDNWNGDFRKIKVTVDRQHVEVRARSGYFATPSASVTVPDTRTMLERIAASPLESNALTLFAKVNMAAASEAKSGHRADVFVNIDPQHLNMSLANGRWKGRVAAAFVQIDARGALLQDGLAVQTANIDITPETHDVLMQSALKLEQKLSLDPKAVLLCVIAVDATTGEAGSIHIPLAKYMPGAPSKP